MPLSGDRRIVIWLARAGNNPARAGGFQPLFAPHSNTDHCSAITSLFGADVQLILRKPTLVLKLHCDCVVNGSIRPLFKTLGCHVRQSHYDGCQKTGNGRNAVCRLRGLAPNKRRDYQRELTHHSPSLAAQTGIGFFALAIGTDSIRTGGFEFFIRPVQMLDYVV